MCPKEFGELVKSQAYVAESLDKEMTLEVGVPSDQISHILALSSVGRAPL